MRTPNETLVGNLIHAAYEDGDRGAEDHGPNLVAARDALMIRLGELERMAGGHQDRPGEAEVRPVPGGQDPADQERGEDLPTLRRVAADPGAAGDAIPAVLAWLNLEGIQVDPLAASVNHFIELLGQEYMARTRDDINPWFHARMFGWVCGPCRTWEMHRSEPEREAALVRHTGRTRW